MIKDDCIFCKIANGEIGSHSLYEDDNFRVILDLAPASLGHALILPKKHYENLYDLGQEEASEIIKLAQKLGKTMVESLQCDGLNLLQNNGKAAGQTVFHYHMHLIPRYEGEKKILIWAAGSSKEEELKKIVEQIKGAMH